MNLRHIRLSDEARDCIKHNWPTHIHVHVNLAGETARKAEKVDLVARWKPYCNGEAAYGGTRGSKRGLVRPWLVKYSD